MKVKQFLAETAEDDDAVLWTFDCDVGGFPKDAKVILRKREMVKNAKRHWEGEGADVAFTTVFGHWLSCLEDIRALIQITLKVCYRF